MTQCYWAHDSIRETDSPLYSSRTISHLDHHQMFTVAGYLNQDGSLGVNLLNRKPKSPYSSCAYESSLWTAHNLGEVPSFSLQIKTALVKQIPKYWQVNKPRGKGENLKSQLTSHDNWREVKQLLLVSSVLHDNANSPLLGAQKIFFTENFLPAYCMQSLKLKSGLVWEIEWSNQ